jgi:TRAP-type C4-dicarboxylate transport system permease small subunit
MLKGLERFFDVFGKMEMWTSAVLLLAITAIILLQVFCRYFLGAPLIWPEELATILSIWLTFIGAGYVYKKNRHLMMGYLVEKFPAPMRSFIDSLTHIAVLIFCYYIIKGGLRLIPIQGRNLTPALRIPSSFYTLPVVISSLALILFILFLLLQKVFASRKTGRR